MSWNDLSLSALGSASANAGVSSQAAAGLRDAGTGSSFEQELKRQTEAGDSSETAQGNTTATARPVTAAPATATAGADKAAAEPAAGNAAGTATDDAPADWLALLGGMRAMAEAKPAEAVPEPLAAAASAVAAVAKAVAQPVIDPVTAWAAPGAGEPDAVEVEVAADAATAATKPASAPAKDTEHQASEPLPLANALLDGTQLPPLFAPLSTAAPALQPAAPVIDAAAAPASAALKSATDSPGQRAQQPPDLPEPGQLDAVAARALAAAAPQPTRPAAVPTGAAANAPDTPPAVEAQALALPAATGLAAATERLPELVPVARHVATPLGQRGWDQAVSQQVSWLVRDQLQSASLSLNPPHLGPIQVTLQLDQQQATVQFVAAAPEVRQALQDALPTLRAMLGEAGISLGQADVGSRQPERERAAPQRSARGAPAAEDEPLEALAQPRAQGGGLVNLFA